MNKLAEQLIGKDWFHSVGNDEFGRYVVYVKFFNIDHLKSIPSEFDGKQVLVHISGYQELKPIKPIVLAPETVLPSIESSSDDVLIIEEAIWQLRRECGTDNLIDILYEVHEQTTGKGNMYLTNMSKEFPEVRKSLEKLYANFGFDVLFDQIEIDL